MTPRILILHGVNLGMFGKRDPRHYGTQTLDDINARLSALAEELHVAIAVFQSDSEADFVRRIHQAQEDGSSAVVVNAGAWTHYNYAIADALAILRIPIVEVHMSNVHAREPFRRHSVLSDVVRGSVCGFGVDSYLLGLRAAVGQLKQG